MTEQRQRDRRGPRRGRPDRGRASPRASTPRRWSAARGPRQGGQVRRPGAALAGLTGDRLRRPPSTRPRADGRDHARRRWGSAWPRPSSGSCGACSSSRPGSDAPPTALVNPRDRVALGEDWPRPRRAASACPASSSRSSARSTSRVSAVDAARRAALDRGLGPRGARDPARDRPPRRRPDPRSGPTREQRKGAMRALREGEHLRAAAPRGGRGAARGRRRARARRLEDRLPRHLRVRGRRCCGASPGAAHRPGAGRHARRTAARAGAAGSPRRPRPRPRASSGSSCTRPRASTTRSRWSGCGRPRPRRSSSAPSAS